MHNVVSSFVGGTALGQEIVDELAGLVEAATAGRRLTGEQAREARLGLALSIMDADSGGADRRFRPAALTVLYRPMAERAAVEAGNGERPWEG
jgi:hypothetical protein